MAHVLNNNQNNHDNDLITDNEATTNTHVEASQEEVANTSLPSPIAIVTSPTSTTAAEATGPAVAGNAVSFSPLPMGRSFAESYPTRRFHEFGSSPARSLVHVLETAEAAGVGFQDDQWVTNASVATGTSGVHFQPQRGGQFAHSHFRRVGSGSGSGAWMATSMPESRFSEFEVVYDDGVRKQRTFSLTTELDEDERSSSDNDEYGSEHDRLLEYQEVRPSNHDNPHFSDDAIHAHLGYPGLMQGGAGTTPPTFSSSIPSTHNHSTTTPLLNKQHPYYSSPAGAGARLYPQQSKRRDKPAEYLTRASQTVWSYVSGNAIPLPTKRILKASLAYLLACLVSFTPIFLPYIGMSGHLAASSAVFFNPAKTLGRMVDAVTAGLSAIAFGVLVSVASMLSAIWFNSRDLYIWGHVVSVVVFGGGSTFIIAYAKAYFNRPTVNVACTLSHIMILVTLTKEGAQSLGEFNVARVLAITTSMLLGVAISTLISIFLWPESAHEKLRQDMGKSLTSFRLLLKLLTKTFLLESDTTPFGSESVQKLIETQVKSFSALAKSLEEAQLEFPGPDIKKYESCVKSLNTLAQYLNGLRSSCGLQYDMLKKDEHLKDNAPKPQSSTTRETGPNGAGVGAGVDSGSGGRKALGFGMRMSSFSVIGGMNQDQEQSASADLIEFLEHVGKPMKSLALTCKLTIEHLQDIFTSTDGDKKAALGRFNSRGRVSQSHVRQSGYESGEVFSDSTFDIGTSNTHPNVSTDAFKKSPSLMLMQTNLAKALDIFEKANSKALKRFYSHQNKRRSGHFKRPFGMSKPMSEPTLHDLGFVGLGNVPDMHGQQDALTEKAPVGEQIFLVYFFVFNLMEFSKELTHLVNCVEELVDGDDGLPMWIERNRQPWWKRIWFSLTGFPRRLRRPVVRQQAFEDFDDPEPGNRPPASHYSHSHSPSQSHTPNHSNHASSNQGGRQRKQRLFPKPNLHNKTDTLHTPRPSTFLQKWSTRLWRFLHVFRSFQVKYAAKAAISTMVLLIPAFVDWTRPYFVQYRGEWALISMLIVMVPTVGGTNIVGIYRIMGTVVGCYAGVAIYLLFPANDILLPICCFLFAVPNFYLVLCSAYPRIGQVTLLAFNLVLIQTYNRRHGDGTVPPDDDEDDDQIGGPVTPTKAMRALGSLLGETDPNDPNHVSYVWTIALHRAVAVSFGVVVGVAVTSYVWPYEARVELRKGLSDLLLNISWLYNRLVSVYSTNLDKVSVIPPQKPYRGPRERVQEILRRTTFQERFQAPLDEYEELPDDPTESDMDRMNKEFMAIELSLQLQLLRLYSLLEETPNEPRLKGKFPVRTYKNMLGSCQNILDRFLSMRLVITKDEWIESARRDFIVPVNKERREMVGNVLLYFYTIASALRLKTPLPPYLPPANNARLRLIQKIRQLPVVQNKVVMTEDNDERYVFYYAYALVMDDVIRELERLGRWSQDLFGVITPAIEFEAWFTDDGAPPTLPWPSADLPSSATRGAPLSPLHDIDPPFEYPDRPQAISPSASDPQQRSVIQRPLSSPGNYRQRPDEASLLMDTESQTPSQDIQDRDGMFDFDPQDPFRDIPNSPAGGGASSPFQRGERRLNSSQSLNDAMSATSTPQQPYHDKGIKPRRQGSHASRSSQGSRQHPQPPPQRGNGSTTQLPPNAVGAQPQQRAASFGGCSGHSGAGRASSMKKSSSGSFSSYNRTATNASISSGDGSGQNSRPLSVSGSNNQLFAPARDQS